jgi:phage terminase small subunit
MAAMSKAEIIEALVAAGNLRSKATLYADAYLEYTTATENIDQYGMVVNHPRTGNPIENPYLDLRDKALKKLLGFKGIKAECLWSGPLAIK